MVNILEKNNGSPSNMVPLLRPLVDSLCHPGAGCTTFLDGGFNPSQKYDGQLG